MIQFFKDTNYNFVKYKAIMISISLIIIIGSFISLIFWHGPNLSIDFTGGTLLQMKFQKPVQNDIGKIRGIISDLGFGSPEIKTIGPESHNEIQITVKKKAEGTVVIDQVRAALSKSYAENPFELRRQELVGPRIGKELKTNALIAIALSLIALLVYVGFRFSLPFGVAAIVPIFHDVIIALSFYFFLGREISLATIAALLTIAGYSLNDTIVIFDRVRENLRAGGLKGKNFEALINLSVNQTLSRTIITFLAMIFVVAALFFIGGESIRDFSLAMFVGTVAGVYSTIYIASPILIWWNKRWPITK